MSFNIPITIDGDVSTDSITRPNGYESVELGSVLDLSQVQFTLNEEGDMSAYRCGACDEELNEADPTETLADGDTECLGADDGKHQPVIVPFTWAKNITVDFDEEDDRIDLAIATSDPRGGWVFRLRRGPDGKVIMHLPHATMDGPHEPIRELHPGTFEIG